MLASFLNRLPGRWQYLTSLPAYQRAPQRTLWRAFEWRVRCALKLPTVVSVPKWQAKLSLSPVWKGAGVTLFYVVREEYEPEVTFLEKIVSAGDVFVDAGANCGVYTVAAAHFVGPKGRVLSFEPGEDSLAMLRRNVALNHFDHVTVLPLALSETTGTARLFERCRPKVIFEINPDAIARLGLSERGAWDFLATRGYRFFTMQEDGTLIAATDPSGANVVALHPEQHALPAA